MSNSTIKRDSSLVSDIKKIVDKYPCQKIVSRFNRRLEQGSITRDENPYDHFCIYFAAYDAQQKLVFLGRHKKSDLWLFNGGHIDIGESPQDTLYREIGEEWGVNVNYESIGDPKFFSVTRTINPEKIKCERHYDIWYFVPLVKKDFKPDRKKLAEEFYETQWADVITARQLVKDENTKKAILTIEKLFV